MRRVVVTGLGLVTPLGSGVDVNWQRLTPDERHTLRAETGLLPMARPAVSSPEEIVAALSARSLGQWDDMLRSPESCCLPIKKP